MEVINLIRIRIKEVKLHYARLISTIKRNKVVSFIWGINMIVTTFD